MAFMNRVLRSAIAVTSLWGLALAATGCSGSAASKDTDKDSGPLTVWVMGDSSENFDKLVAGFTAETGIEVNAEAIPWDGVNDKLTTAVASGEGPDATQVGLSNLAAFQHAGALLDLTDYLDEHPGLASDNFPAAVAADKTSDAGQTSVPWTSDTRVLFYRKDLLEAAGVEPPQTWAELQDAASALATGDDQFGFYIPQWDQALPAEFTWEAGGDIVDDEGRVSLDSDEFRKAADFYLSFYEKGLVPTNGDFDQVQGFVSGAAPMLISGPYFGAAVSGAAPELDGKWDVVKLPSDQTGTSLFAGSNFAAWHNTKHADAAVELLDYLAEPQTQLMWFEMTGELPTTNEALLDESLTSDPHVATYVDQLSDAQLLPLVPKWDQIAAEVLGALNEVALNGADKDSTLADLNSTIEDLQQ